MKKLFTFALLAALFALAGCGRGDPRHEYVGTWKYDLGHMWFQVSITADKLVFAESVIGDGYTLDSLAWEPLTDSVTGLSGYRFSGRLAAATDFYIDNLPKADGSGAAALNDTAAVCWYIAADGKTLYPAGWPSAEVYTHSPYARQRR